MNITHFDNMPTEAEVPVLSREAWEELVQRRLNTFRGFAEIEAAKGFVQPTVNLHTPRGQDTIRLMSYRVIEEIVESREGEEIPHRLEELIDAANYLISLALLDPETVPFDQVVDACVKASVRAIQLQEVAEQHLHHNHRLTDSSFAEIVDRLVGPVGDVLRNRAWTMTAQDIFFSHTDLLLDMVSDVLGHIMAVFPDWKTFYRYFVGKDNVLRFRLSTGY